MSHVKNIENKIRWIMNHRVVNSTKDVKQYLKEIDGITDISLRTIQRHMKNIKDKKNKKEREQQLEQQAEKKKQKVEIKQAVKAERKQQYPYYITTPCEHKQRLKITNNPIQSVGCGNCGCTWDRAKGIWIDRFTGNNWGENPKSKHCISGTNNKLSFDYNDQFNRHRSNNYV